MTSLLQLGETEKDKEILQKLADHGIVTDEDLLLADDATIGRCKIAKPVRVQRPMALTLLGPRCIF